MATGVVYTTYGFGDSFTYGQGGTTQANSWFNLTCVNKSYELLNSGVSGQSISTGAPSTFNLLNVPLKGRYNKRLFCGWGINDCNSTTFPAGNQSNFIAAYTAFFNQCITNGWVYSEIVCISQYLLYSAYQSNFPNYNSYAAALESLCTSLGIKFINCKSYMNANGGDSLFIVGGGNDGHPNDTGYAVIATYVQSQL